MAEKIPALITAVHSSPTLSGRSMMRIGDLTVLEMIVSRLQQADCISRIVLCTSVGKEDNVLADRAAELGIDCVRGHRDDMAARLSAALEFCNSPSAFLVRGDAPLIDVHQCGRLLASHVRENAEFSYNEHLFGLPYGLGCEIITRSALDRIRYKTPGQLYSQKISLFIRLNSSMFSICRKEYESPDPDARFILETRRDHEFLCEVVSQAGIHADTAALLHTMDRHPYLKKLSSTTDRASEFGLDKLLLHPEKLRNLVSDDPDESYPVSVELSLTNDCNLGCTWCSDSKLRAARPGTLDITVYKDLVQDLAAKQTRGLVLEGGGEPCLHPEFSKALELALDSDLAVGLITNGTLFTFEEFLPRMEWVRVSLDADSPETFREFKGKDFFDRVIANIRRMCAAKESCTIGVGYVVTRDNIRNLEEITILLNDLGVDYLYLRPVIDHPEMRIEENLYYLRKYETDSFRVLIHAMQENTVTGNNELPCVAHSLSTVIASDGSVFLCGRLNIFDWMEPIGNINSESFGNIWRGSRRREQSAQVRDGSFCSQWCPECRMTKYNTVLERLKQVRTVNFI